MPEVTLYVEAVWALCWNDLAEVARCCLGSGMRSTRTGGSFRLYLPPLSVVGTQLLTAVLTIPGAAGLLFGQQDMDTVDACQRSGRPKFLLEDELLRSGQPASTNDETCVIQLPSAGEVVPKP